MIKGAHGALAAALAASSLPVHLVKSDCCGDRAAKLGVCTLRAQPKSNSASPLIAIRIFSGPNLFGTLSIPNHTTAGSEATRNCGVVVASSSEIAKDAKATAKPCFAGRALSPPRLRPAGAQRFACG